MFNSLSLCIDVHWVPDHHRHHLQCLDQRLGDAETAAEPGARDHLLQGQGHLGGAEAAEGTLWNESLTFSVLELRENNYMAVVWIATRQELIHTVSCALNLESEL